MLLVGNVIRKECEKYMAIINRKYDIVVVGGGMSGLCAALASARHGARTALVHNRPVLGGNASSEIRMHICGADYHTTRPNARETGIIEELLLENKKRNPLHSFSIFDTVLWEKARFQDKLDIYLNSHMTEVNANEGFISSIIAHQLTTEKVFKIEGNIFVDATGDGTLAFLAGAECMCGREGKDVFGEKYAPDKSDNFTMGNTLLFKAVDTGKPVTFEKPIWADTYQEEDLIFRNHDAITSGYWWIELGGEKMNVIADAEELRDDLLKAVYGMWDHIKNRGNHGAENYILDWVGFLPGKRESRRVKGDYILKEQDLLEGIIFEDAVAYGGWPMDMHVVGGLLTKEEPTNYIHLDNVYTIPYRSLYSKDVRNLMMAGRNISVSHMAFGSTRVMATCSVIGQAVGTAGAMIVEKGILPRDILEYINELQQTLIKDDCFIPGFKNEDVSDIGRKAKIYCSSSLKGFECGNVSNGITRRCNSLNNRWISSELRNEPEWIDLVFDSTFVPKEVHIKFDSNLSNDIMISLSDKVINKQLPGVPPELVKDYDIELYNKDRLIYSMNTYNNFFRYKVHKIDHHLECDRIRILVKSTNGDKHARIFEVRVY